ncbi:DNA-binding protein [Vibrio coralliilyticus]|nr:DNA-binding protein [Vibrio coralliilyticus]
MLSLDGKLLPIDNMKVSCSKQYKDKDMSGQSSSTHSSEQGDKGVVISVAGTIPFKREADLTALYDTFSMKDENGNRKVFRISNRDAKLYRVRNAKFFGKLSSSEHNSLRAWEVSFSMREHNSVAEKIEQRTQANNPPTQTQNTQHQQALLESEEALK